jgi:formylglycine-generating enzyme required for sulfatase activity
MGDPSSTSQTLTAHSVTLTGFCIAETEMTRNVYNRVYESSATTETETPHIIGISYMTDLMDQFYSCTHAEFSLPSEAQWEYAAKGGVKSKGYIYSGSNILDEVAWYRDNSNSRKAVKLKLPNELGLYDMSGNEREHVLDYYNNYTADSVTDPVSTTKAQCHVVRGGGYSSSADGCTNIYRGMNIYYTTYNSYNDGLECAVRLTLNWDN